MVNHLYIALPAIVVDQFKYSWGPQKCLLLACNVEINDNEINYLYLFVKSVFVKSQFCD